MNNPPNEETARQIVKNALHEEAVNVVRFTTGLCHYVYDVQTANGQHFVVRIAHNTEDALRGGVYWSNLLRPLGVPLPDMLYHDLSASVVAYPYVVLERLPGKDLGSVYTTLSAEQKRQLAAQIVDIQNKVRTLPPGKGYGFVNSYETNFPAQSWQEVIENALQGNGERIERNELFSPEIVKGIERYLPSFERYFAGIEPRLFLDDTTTKNVIISKGALSGIVDVDTPCFGDPLYTVALTRTSLISSGWDTNYVNYWCDYLQLSVEQERALDFYTLVFCTDFLSEMGTIFNKAEPEPVDNIRVTRLLTAIKEITQKL
jgi:aminoglycoside phosphotransferase (APT) family kinase protein